MTLDIREFHTHFIAIQDVPDHDWWKQHFVTAIDNEVNEKDKAVMRNVDHWESRNNSITSYFYEHSTVDYEDFTEQVVKPVVDNVLKSLDFNYFPVKDVAYWYNRYDQMGTHEIHDHPDTDLCLIYLLHLEEPNTTVFHNTMYTQKYFQREMYTEDLTEGKIIIFPSHLQHEVQWSDYKRYTIAGNIDLDYEPKISQSD
jgi:hypothetical protein